MSRWVMRFLKWSMLLGMVGACCFAMGCGRNTLPPEMAVRNVELAQTESQLAERLSSFDFEAAWKACQFSVSALEAGERSIEGLPGGTAQERVGKAKSLALFREGTETLVLNVSDAAANETKAREEAAASLEQLREARRRFAQEVEPALAEWRRMLSKTSGRLVEWRTLRLEKQEAEEYESFLAFADAEALYFPIWEQGAGQIRLLDEKARKELHFAVVAAKQTLDTQVKQVFDERRQEDKWLAAIRARPISQALVVKVRKDNQDSLQDLFSALNEPPAPGWTKAAPAVQDIHSKIEELQRQLISISTAKFMEKSIGFSLAIRQLEREVVALPVWTPGTRHPNKPHVFATDQTNTWDADPGYWFVNPGTNSDLVVRWTPGLCYPGHPNISAGPVEGTWVPDAGYKARWNGDLDPEWTPGTRHPTVPHIFAALEDGEKVWAPDPGYWFVHPGANSDLSVRWTPGRRHPDHPNVSAGEIERTWTPKPGFKARWPDDLDPDWMPGAKHPDYPHIHATDEPLIWATDPGYEAVEPETSNLNVRWKPGATNPEHPNITAGQVEGTWKPDPGYKARRTGDLDPVWAPGAKHPVYPHIHASDKQRTWSADPGYEWVEPGTSNLQVRWKPGLRHPDHKGVEASRSEGKWDVKPGWTWVHPGTSDLSAKWVPGTPKPGAPFVHASDTEGVWAPDAGYRFKSLANDDDFSVEWTPGSRHPAYPHIYASDKQQTWGADPGYEWVEPGTSNLQVRWKPGLRHPDHKGVEASRREGKWDVKPGWTWVHPGTSDLSAKWVPGTPKPGAPHVHASDTEGVWAPDAGYRFKSMANDDDFSVEWIGR